MNCSEVRLIPPALLTEALARTPLNYFVVWTGAPATGRASSVRARAFDCIQEVGVPVSLRELLQRAARIEGLWGLEPDAVRSAVRQHQFAKPAVLMLVEKNASGEYRAVSDIPFAGALHRRFAAGSVVVDRDGVCAFNAPVVFRQQRRQLAS